MREYGVRNYDAEATHKDYLIGDISHIGATRLGRAFINVQIAVPHHKQCLAAAIDEAMVERATHADALLH